MPHDGVRDGRLVSDRRDPDGATFPGLPMTGIVESETEREGKTQREYYLSSAKLDAEIFAWAARATLVNRLTAG